jgi:hypothetical protein
MPRLRTLLALSVAFSVITSKGIHAATPTFHRDVERILQKHCQDCHRPGQVAPFSLLTYEQARKRAGDLVSVTERKRMPPWPASTRVGGPFRDAQVLSDREFGTLLAWEEADCPQGDPADAPPPRTWDSDWPLGAPDLELRMSEPYALSADGADEFRVFVLPTGLTEGKWVSAVDYKPGSPKVVHHVIAAIDNQGLARILDKADPKPGYRVFSGFGAFWPVGMLGGWSPGKSATPLPKGVGRYLPSGSDVLLQVHYHKSGKPEIDATAVGLYFAKETIEKELRVKTVVPPVSGFLEIPKLHIPAGAANHEVTATETIDDDAHLVGVTPHMHWLGKDFLLKAARPDGSTLTLIKINRWDFNWQGSYEFVEPVALPKGTRIDMVAHFDNSARNPANPSSPPRDVRWGEQTTDEMCIGFFDITFDDEHRENSVPSRFRKARRRAP